MVLPASRGPFQSMDEMRKGIESDLEMLTLYTNDQMMRMWGKLTGFSIGQVLRFTQCQSGLVLDRI